MSKKNSVLLIIKQANGINYNELLAKMSSGYSGVNSARAALSRSLKDMAAVGLIARVDNRILITDKGNQSMGSEMKHKLLMKLNSLVGAKDNYYRPDEIVKNMQALIERSKQDSELLKAARGSAEFSISDLEIMRDRTIDRLKQLDYLSSVFSKQVEALKEMDFNDKAVFPSKEGILKKIIGALGIDSSEDAVVEVSDSEKAEALAKTLNSKAKKNSITLKAGELPLLAKEMGEASTFGAKAYLGSIAIRFSMGRMIVQGPYSKIVFLKKMESTIKAGSRKQ